MRTVRAQNALRICVLRSGLNRIFRFEADRPLCSQSIHVCARWDALVLWGTCINTMQIEHRAAGTFHEVAARLARSMAGRLQALAGVCIFPFGPISLIVPCLKISLGAVRQEHLPCVLEIRAGFFEGRGGVGLMRAWIETAAPFPRIGIVRIADALGNRPDMNIAVIRNRCASSYGGGLRIGGA